MFNNFFKYLIFIWVIGLLIACEPTTSATETLFPTATLEHERVPASVTPSPLISVTETTPTLTTTEISVVIEPTLTNQPATPEPTQTLIPTPTTDNALLPRLHLWEQYSVYYSRRPKDALTGNSPEEALTVAAMTPDPYPPCPTCTHAVPDHQRYKDSMPATGPAQAVTLEFAHYANFVAYWTNSEKGQLWVADMELTEPKVVFTDENEIYTPFEDVSLPYLDFIWTPDDLHLILDPRNKELPNLIYHQQTGQVEEWPWLCNRFAISPRTQQVAWWCGSEQDLEEFAVIEWGGEIWISPSEPEQIIVQYEIDRTKQWQENWAWSSDGQQMAYFDPADEEGHLWLTSLQGNITSQFPGSAWWLNYQSLYPFSGDTLHWSFDKQKLLVYAYELYPSACPPYNDLSSMSDDPIKQPCWQLVDTKNYELIWSWQSTWSASELPEEDKLVFWVGDATISSDGQYIGLTYLVIPHYSLILIRLPQQDAQWGFNNGPSAMRWYIPNPE